MPVKNVILGQPATREKVQRAKELRSVMTPAEAVLWGQLRKNKLGGFHFRRQQVIDGFIVDFYCHECALAVEIDGAVHAAHREHDAERDAALSRRGFRTLRFSNDRVLNDIESVLTEILQTCLSLRHPLPASGRRPGGLGPESL
jgi:very-short-patch-repair endonuclease